MRGNQQKLSAIVEGKAILLGPGEILIGRSPFSEIFLYNEYVSWKHASFILSENKLFIKDNNSTNGTFVNNVPIKGIVQLSVGDEILIAQEVVITIKSLISKKVATEKSTTGYGTVLILSPENLLDMLERNIELIYKISPEQFELLVCNRLEKMGFNIQRIGSVYVPDGGVDIIAYSDHPVLFPSVIAVQAKHHKSPKIKSGPKEVREMHSIVNTLPFQGGIIVTNSYFTQDAKWFANKKPHLVRLRDFDDLRRWVNNEYYSDKETLELPRSIEIRSGKTVCVPKQKKN